MATIDSVSRGVASRKARWLVSGIVFGTMLPACGGDSSLVDASGSVSGQSIAPSSAEFEPARLKSRALTLPDSASSLRALERVPEGTAQAVLVQLSKNPTREERSRLKAEGLRLEQFLGGGTWFARAERRAVGSELVRRNVRGSWTTSADDRLDERLASGDVPASALRANAELVVSVLAFSGTSLDDAARDVTALGGTVESQVGAFDTLFVRLPRSEVWRLAALDWVHWVEPVVGAPGPEMNRARSHLLAHPVAAPPYSLTGAGVTVAVHDTGHAWNLHPDLAGRVFQGDAADESLQVAQHPSMTAGTIAGNGSLDSSFRGFASQAQIYSYSFAGPSDPTDTSMANLLGDVADSLTRGIDVANNSWGFFCGELPYGVYGTQARAFDSQVLGRDADGNSIGSPMVVVFSGGNERDGSGNENTMSCISNRTAPFANYGTINQPKSAKNVLVVGAVDSADDRMTTYSSWGPTSDGRLRPDVVAAGHHQGTAAAGVSAITPELCFGSPTGAANQQCFRTPGKDLTFDGYAWFSQTSAAAAMASGSAALFIEDFRARNGGSDPEPATVKAHLIHTAVDLDDTTSWYNRGPDYASGYGRLNVHEAIDQLRSGHWIEDCVEQGESRSLTFAVPTLAREVKVTLVWSDEPGAPGSTAPALVNDLDLVVRDGAGVRSYPWTLNAASPASPAVRNVEDHLNNVEQVLVDGSFATGGFTLEVRGTAVPSGPQCYSLVYSAPLKQVQGGFAFTPIHFPGALETRALGISNNGLIVGSFRTASGTFPFRRSASGSYLQSGTSFAGGDVVTSTDINDNLVLGDSVGFLTPSSSLQPMRSFAVPCSSNSGFVGCFPEIVSQIPGGGSSAIWGINSSRVYAGYYHESGQHGFTLAGTTFTTIDYPGAQTTRASGIANDGTVSGTYYDGVRLNGFLRNGANYQTVNVTGSTIETDITGVNDAGHLAATHTNDPLRQTFRGSYFDGSSWSEIVIPGATSIQVHDLNDSNAIVGFQMGSNGTRGFLATPLPRNTPVGTNVVVVPIDTASGAAPVTVTFEQVTAAGDTTLVIGPATLPSPEGFSLCQPPVNFELHTSAELAPGSDIRVCIARSYLGTCSGTPTLQHYVDGAWVEVPTTVTASEICGTVQSFSYFGVFVRDKVSVTFTDASGDQTSPINIDVTRLTLEFDPSTGDYELIWTAHILRPFRGTFRLNANLYNVDAGPSTNPAYFSDTLNDFNLVRPLTVVRLTGNNPRLKAWSAGQRVVPSCPQPLGCPTGMRGFGTAVGPLSGSSQGIDSFPAQAPVGQRL